MKLEIDCESPEEVTATKRLIAEHQLKVVQEWQSPEGHCCFAHLFWVEGTAEALYEVIKTWENISFEEALKWIERDTGRFVEKQS